MATLITLPHEIQSRIAHFLRPPHSDPFEKSPEIARFKGVHSNLRKVLFWVGKKKLIMTIGIKIVMWKLCTEQP